MGAEVGVLRLAGAGALKPGAAPRAPPAPHTRIRGPLPPPTRPPTRPTHPPSRPPRQDTSAARRAPTAADLFARHTALHPFLLAQLSEAVGALEALPPGRGAAPLHPSLFPILVLLSRLRCVGGRVGWVGWVGWVGIR